MKKILAGLIFTMLFFGMAGNAMAATYAYAIRDDATGGDCTQIGIGLQRLAY